MWQLIWHQIDHHTGSRWLTSDLKKRNCVIVGSHRLIGFQVQAPEHLRNLKLVLIHSVFLRPSMDCRPSSLEDRHILFWMLQIWDLIQQNLTVMPKMCQESWNSMSIPWCLSSIEFQMWSIGGNNNLTNISSNTGNSKDATKPTQLGRFNAQLSRLAPIVIFSYVHVRKKYTTFMVVLWRWQLTKIVEIESCCHEVGTLDNSLS